jgi:hypothetical protein
MKTKGWLMFLSLHFLVWANHLVAQTTAGNQLVINVPISGTATEHALLTLPDDYGTTTGNYPLLVFLHGVGEAGNNFATLYTSTGSGGPAYFIAQNQWPTSFTNPADGKAYKFIVVCPQAPTFSTSGPQLDFVVKWLVANYRVDITRLYLTGLSAGGAGIFDYVTHTGVNPTYKPAAFVPMSMDEGVPQQAMENTVVADSDRAWGFGSETDILGINTHIFIMGAYGGNGGSIVGLGYLGRFTDFTGGHCCWNQFYNPAYTENINGQVMNIYQWMLMYTRGAAVPPPPPPPTPPTANAGVDQSVTLPVSTVSLDGSGSKAATGNTISSYGWSQLTGPTGDAITAPAGVSTTVTALVQGVYEFQLTVTDNLGSLTKDTIQVTVNAAAPPAAPTANAGVDQSITLPLDSASLDGSASKAATGNSISTYSWVLISGPAGDALTTPALSTTMVTDMVQGVYQFQLTVTDNLGNSSKDTVQVTVNAAVPPPPPPTPPTANAGVDQAITLPVSTITLDGSGSKAATGNSISSYGWAQISGPSGDAITTPATVSTTVTALVQGVYQFQLTVTDNLGTITKDTIQVTVNAAVPVIPPTVVAGANQVLTLPVSIATLDGSGSTAAAGNTIVSFSWVQLSGPSGAILSSPGQAVTPVLALGQGVYKFQLTVTDDKGSSAQGTVQITVNAAPTGPVPPGGGKNIVKVGCGEYFTSYVTDENKIYATLWNGATNSNQFLPFPLANIVDVDGAQYTNICRSSAGNVYVIRKALVGGGPDIVNFTTDAYGNPFTGNSKAYGWFKSYLTIKNDSIYYFGEDQLNINGGVAITAPIRLNQPPGRKVVKIVVQDVTADITALLTIMCSDGTVWQYNRGSATPVQIVLPAAATDITSIGRACYVVETATDLLAWGPYASYLGLPNYTTTPTSILSKWTAVGLKWPLKQIVGNWNTLHIIDANNNLFGTGDNMEGEVGNGVMYSNWKNYVYAGSPSPYAWSWIKFSLMQTPVQIPGKFTNLCGSNSIAFFFFVQDECMGNWYSWGRNKEYALGNGLRISNDDIYADWRCVPAPTLVHPSTQVWPADALFDPNANQAPNANAGVGQCVNINMANLSAALSFQDGGTISSYSWSQVSGPTGAVITTPGSVNTTVTGLVTGLYTFRVTVKNNFGMVSTDDVLINVNATPNIPPVANGGGNQTITLPVNTVTLSGSGTDADGTVASFLWTKVSGPSQFAIISSGTATTDITNLVQGVYTFQLTVTDNLGASGTTTVTVTVLPAPIVPGPPVVSAGVDQVITLPANSTTLTGTASETNGTITTYQWVQLSGPAASGIGTPGQVSTGISGLVQGVYTFQLTITDNSGVKASDVVKVTVNPASPVPGLPVVSAGTNQTITLPVNTATLTATASEVSGTIVTYQWVQVSGPTASVIGTPGQASTGVSGLVQGVYSYQITVIDNSNVQATDVVKVTVNPASIVAGPPSANAGVDQTITLPVNNVILTGIGTETNGTIVTYQWVQLSGPAASLINAPDQSQVTVGSMVQGTYNFQLTVTDNSGVKATATVKVIVNPAPVPPPPPNIPPVADAGPDMSVTSTAAVMLDGSNSYDPDGSIAIYSWMQISGAGGVTITNANTATPNLYGLQPGVYSFELTVTDGSGATATDDVTITVTLGQPGTGPVAIAGNDTTVTYPIGNVAILNGSASYDGGGRLTGYSWKQISGPGAATMADKAAMVTDVQGLVPGSYTFQLTVTDNNNLTSSKTVTVHVTSNLRVGGPGNNLHLYPNPVLQGQDFTIDGDASRSGGIKFAIVDIRGRVLQTVELISQATSFTQTFSTSGLGKGAYILLVQFANSGKPVALKFIVD